LVFTLAIAISLAEMRANPSYYRWKWVCLSYNFPGFLKRLIIGTTESLTLSDCGQKSSNIAVARTSILARRRFFRVLRTLVRTVATAAMVRTGADFSLPNF
jgi:hypothetical protein